MVSLKRCDHCSKEMPTMTDDPETCWQVRLIVESGPFLAAKTPRKIDECFHFDACSYECALACTSLAQSRMKETIGTKRTKAARS